MIPTAEAQYKTTRQAEKKQERAERDYRKSYAKARKITLKHRREIQSEATKKMMDEADKRAKAFNKQGDPGFFESLFKTKRRKKR
jgi:hypothetical protein